MTTKKLAVALLVFAATVIFVYRDAGADLCPGKDDGCWTPIAVPCTGSAACAIVSGSTVPGGVTKCTDNTTAVYWAADPPDSWVDCITRTGSGACNRASHVCMTVDLFKTLSACNNGTPCGSNDVDACGIEGTPKKCN